MKMQVKDGLSRRRAVVKALDPDGVRIAQFNGAPAGQTVFHLHFHIIPVYEGATLAPHAGGKADPADLEALAMKIRAALI
jgi:histidine triad (HIT) family protein